MSRPRPGAGDVDAAQSFRLLPPVDEVLRDPRVASLASRVGRELVAVFAAEAIESWRGEIRAGRLAAAEIETRLARGDLASFVEALVRREEQKGVRRAINATGVVLNTGLGRAPVHPEVAEAMAEAARSYCVLEIDRWSGERNERDQRLSELLVRLTGAEAAIGVNNNAGAVLLLFQTFAGGRQAIVSRGELVEIGGSFRVPDVMARAGAELVEVGTTNRTRRADYERAVNERTGLIVKVHTSNFRLVGFTEEATPAEIAALGPRARDRERVRPRVGPRRARGRPAARGAPRRRAARPRGGRERRRRRRVLRGQAPGRAAGRPARRAARGDRGAAEEPRLPRAAARQGRARGPRAHARAPPRRPRRRDPRARDAGARRRGDPPARRLARRAPRPDPGDPRRGDRRRLRARERQRPGRLDPTFVVRVEREGSSASALAARLRAADPPVYARIQEGAVLLDPRTLLAGDEDDLAAALEDRNP
jgi:L-seryl-tRNA(Ser) seleniumtransferase